MKALRIAMVILLASGCLLLASCNNAEILNVKGMNFDQLEAKEFTAEEIWLMWKDHEYGTPWYHVYNENGTLWLNLADSNSPGPFSVYTGYRQLFAEDLGEWGGWVSTANFFSELSQGIVKPENVLTGVGVTGLYQKAYGDPVAYILAGIYNDQKVYRFTDHAEEGWELETVAQLELVPEAALLDGDKLVIAALESLLTVDVNTGETAVLYDVEDWKYNQYNSIAKVGNSYFIGSLLGIYEYRISEGEMLFYPYPDYVPEEG